MVGARVSGRMVTFDYVIQNGDQIEIITSQNSKGPSRDWLNLVKSTQAKNKINQWFKAEIKEDNIIRGRELQYTESEKRSKSFFKSLKNSLLSDISFCHSKIWRSQVNFASSVSLDFFPSCASLYLQ